MRAQGSTEYLVLLAVVLIIALVPITLLGFFPGMASDQQITESQAYWKSASPIAVDDAAAYYFVEWYLGPDRYPTVAHFRIRNTGSYPIRLTKIIGAGDATSHAVSWADSYVNAPTGTYIVEYFTNIYLAPGEETCFGAMEYPQQAYCPKHTVLFNSRATSYAGADDVILKGPNIKVCDSSGGGVLQVPDFGFEYLQYVEGQTITKRQIGSKPLIAKCIGINTWV